MEVIKKRINYVPNCGYSFNFLFTQKTVGGINASDIPDTAIYNPDKTRYDAKIIYDSTKTQEENAIISNIVNEVSKPIQGNRNIDFVAIAQNGNNEIDTQQ
jgi:hypothetical protein